MDNMRKIFILRTLDVTLLTRLCLIPVVLLYRADDVLGDSIGTLFCQPFSEPQASCSRRHAIKSPHPFGILPSHSIISQANLDGVTLQVFDGQQSLSSSAERQSIPIPGSSLAQLFPVQRAECAGGGAVSSPAVFNSRDLSDPIVSNLPSSVSVIALRGGAAADIPSNSFPSSPAHSPDRSSARDSMGGGSGDCDGNRISEDARGIEKGKVTLNETATESGPRMPAVIQRELDVLFMRRAAALALNGIGTTFPNPAVGCVIVQTSCLPISSPSVSIASLYRSHSLGASEIDSDTDVNSAPATNTAAEGLHGNRGECMEPRPTYRYTCRVIGEGWHQVSGGPHAEVVALQSALSAASLAHELDLASDNNLSANPPPAAAVGQAKLGALSMEREGRRGHNMLGESSSGSDECAGGSENRGESEVVDVNRALAGATAYVSLEPCNHFGRTPPCTRALIRHGVKRVVVGMVDPDARVSGQGLQTLRESGLEVEVLSAAPPNAASDDPAFAAQKTPFSPLSDPSTATSTLASNRLLSDQALSAPSTLGANLSPSSSLSCLHNLAEASAEHEINEICRRINAPFVRRVLTKMPFLVALSGWRKLFEWLDKTETVEERTRARGMRKTSRDSDTSAASADGTELRAELKAESRTEQGQDEEEKDEKRERGVVSPEQAGSILRSFIGFVLPEIDVIILPHSLVLMNTQRAQTPKSTNFSLEASQNASKWAWNGAPKAARTGARSVLHSLLSAFPLQVRVAIVLDDPSALQQVLDFISAEGQSHPETGKSSINTGTYSGGKFRKWIIIQDYRVAAHRQPLNGASRYSVSSNSTISGSAQGNHTVFYSHLNATDSDLSGSGGRSRQIMRLLAKEYGSNAVFGLLAEGEEEEESGRGSVLRGGFERDGKTSKARHSENGKGDRKKEEKIGREEERRGENMGHIRQGGGEGVEVGEGVEEGVTEDDAEIEHQPSALALPGLRAQRVVMLSQTEAVAGVPRTGTATAGTATGVSEAGGYDFGGLVERLRKQAAVEGDGVGIPRVLQAMLPAPAADERPAQRSGELVRPRKAESATQTERGTREGGLGVATLLEVDGGATAGFVRAPDPAPSTLSATPAHTHTPHTLSSPRFSSHTSSSAPSSLSSSRSTSSGRGGSSELNGTNTHPASSEVHLQIHWKQSSSTAVSSVSTATPTSIATSATTSSIAHTEIRHPSGLEGKQPHDQQERREFSIQLAADDSREREPVGCVDVYRILLSEASETADPDPNNARDSEGKEGREGEKAREGVELRGDGRIAGRRGLAVRAVHHRRLSDIGRTTYGISSQPLSPVSSPLFPSSSSSRCEERDKGRARERGLLLARGDEHDKNLGRFLFLRDLLPASEAPCSDTDRDSNAETETDSR